MHPNYYITDLEPPSSLLGDYLSSGIILILTVSFYAIFSSSRVGLLLSVRKSTNKHKSDIYAPNFQITLFDQINNFFKIIIVFIVTKVVFLASGSANMSIFLAVLIVIISLSIFLVSSKIIGLLFLRYTPNLIDKITKYSLLYLSPLAKPFAKLLRKYASEVLENQTESEEFALSQIEEPQEKQLIKGIVGLSSTTVKQVMTTKDNIYSVNINMTTREVINYAVDCGYSRLPVYKDNIDNILGFLYIKDLVVSDSYKNNSILWQGYIRKVHFVSKNINIGDLLTEFREKKIHLAVVVGYKGKTEGIITLEDILEEIVGEISDETDK